MATCKFCGAPDLSWQMNEDSKWALLEPDGWMHACTNGDRLRYRKQVEKEQSETAEAVRRYREAQGYL